MTSTTPDRLTAAWTESLVSAGAAPDDLERVLDDLRSRYEEPHRRYHTLEHLDEMLAAVDELADQVDDLDAVRLAVCYHDAIYEPRSSTNEADSAILARDELVGLGLPADRAERVAELVRTTADHTPTGGDAGVLADADLWILGAPPARYRRYADDVRREYGYVSDEGWRLGRAAVLADFLRRDRLYTTDRFHAARDRQARANLAAERRSLT
jgi:predicted metal-dependent HD superfamily phosphohydrolase